MREEDENLSPREKTAKFIQRYKMTGILIVVTPFFAPYAMEALTQNQANAILVPIQSKLNKIEDEVTYSRVFSSVSHMKTLISSEDFNTLVRHRIRSQSLDKIREIKIVWEAADKKSVLGKRRLWSKIKNIIYRNSSIYTNELNKYGHPVVGEVGAYISKTFPLGRNKKRSYRPDYSFLSVVYEITIKDNTENVDYMAENLVEYMKSIQDEYFTDHYKILKKLERENKI